MIEELETVATLPRANGEELRVRVCRSEYGHAVDVRTFVVRSEAERRGGTIKRGRKAVGAFSTFTGPTKAGVWLRPSEAFVLVDALTAAALDAAERDACTTCSDAGESHDPAGRCAVDGCTCERYAAAGGVA